jgi:hypothetical protein
MSVEMPEPHASAASGIAIGIKSGVFAGLFAVGISVLSVVVGFTVVPLAPGKETLDAARRLAAGLLCSFTLGPLVAFKAIDLFPWMLTPWQSMLADQHPLIPTIAAMSPFIALTGLIGFWVVAWVMRAAVRRESKDILEIIKEAKE